MDPTEQDRTRTTSQNAFSPLGELTSDLFRNALNLIRDEVRMAGVEISQKALRAGKSSTVLTVGGFVLYAGFIFLLLAAALGLSRVIAPGWAFLVVGAAALLIGAILVMLGKRRLSADILPSETIDTAKEDTKWMRDKLT